MYIRLFTLFVFTFSLQTMAQDYPFSSIPPAPKNFSASNSICRMIQGLGFRYHWATEGLRAEDLEYRPSDEAQSTLSTIQHIYSLSKTILNAAKNKVSEGPRPIPPDRLDELRAATLDYLQESAELFLNYNEDELNVKSIDEGANKGTLKRALVKAGNSKMKQRVILNQFVSQMAV